jgi:hypothetical protein
VKSHANVRKWVIRQYNGMKGIVRNSLHNAQLKIHISLDLWMSPNALAILGIVAQFVNKDGGLQSSVLAIKEVNREHSGENQAKYVLEVLEEYKIEDKLAYLIMDNADNNDTLMTSPSSFLRRKHNIKYVPKHYRLRCQGHIINLAVKSVLFVTDEENIVEDKETDIIKVTLKEIDEWRKKGPLGKLHNFVVWLAQST